MRYRVYRWKELGKMRRIAKDICQDAIKNRTGRIFLILQRNKFEINFHQSFSFNFYFVLIMTPS